MSERMPTEAEMRAFLERQVAHYCRLGEAAQMNDMLDKLANLGQEREFIALALAARDEVRQGTTCRPGCSCAGGLGYCDRDR